VSAYQRLHPETIDHGRRSIAAGAVVNHWEARIADFRVTPSQPIPSTRSISNSQYAEPGLVDEQVRRRQVFDPYGAASLLCSLEHQVGMTNRLGAIGVQYRAAGQRPCRQRLETVGREVRDLVNYMLFVDGAAP
jgi:hypothetical protein